MILACPLCLRRAPRPGSEVEAVDVAEEEGVMMGVRPALVGGAMQHSKSPLVEAL